MCLNLWFLLAERVSTLYIWVTVLSSGLGKGGADPFECVKERVRSVEVETVGGEMPGRGLAVKKRNVL